MVQILRALCSWPSDLGPSVKVSLQEAIAKKLKGWFQRQFSRLPPTPKVSKIFISMQAGPLGTALQRIPEGEGLKP